MIDIENIENELFALVQKELGWNFPEKIPKDLLKSLSARVARLSKHFTQKRPHVFEDYFENPLDVGAYAMYFHVANMVRTQTIVQKHIKKAVEVVDILDYGTGTSASAMGAIFVYQSLNPDVKINVDLVDQSSRVLGFAKTVLAYFFKEGVVVKGFRSRSFKISKKYDLILCANLINEMKNKTSFLNSMQKGLKNQGKIYLIEPALRGVSRDLMELKTEISDSGMRVVAPCMDQAICPMLKDQQQWCHFEAQWRPPPLRAYFEKQMKYQSGALSYAYLLLGLASTNQTGYRVVSDVLKSKQKKTSCIWLCKGEEIKTLYFEKKHPVLKKLQKGQVLEVTQLEPHAHSKIADGFKLSTQSTIKVQV